MLKRTNQLELNFSKHTELYDILIKADNFWKQLNDMKGWTIETQNLTGSDFYTYDTYTYPNLELYVMKQNDESVKNARNKIKEFTK